MKQIFVIEPISISFAEFNFSIWSQNCENILSGSIFAKTNFREVKKFTFHEY